MRRCRSRASALVAVLALVVALPVERRVACGVCPVDCPMHAHHATAGGQHLGCHEGHSAPRDDAGGCSVRAGCGHEDAATLVLFHAVVPPPVVVRAVVVTRSLLASVPSPRPPFAPAPPTDPPRLPSV